MTMRTSRLLHVEHNICEGLLLNVNQSRRKFKKIVCNGIESHFLRTSKDTCLPVATMGFVVRTRPLPSIPIAQTNLCQQELAEQCRPLASTRRNMLALMLVRKVELISLFLFLNQHCAQTYPRSSPS